MKETQEDELTDLEKQIDGVAKITVAIRAYYVSLIENGFSKDEALQITIAWQNAMVTGRYRP